MSETLASALAAGSGEPGVPAALAAVSANVIGDGIDLDGEIGTLRGGLPLWQRDALTISARVRTIVAALQPVVVRVLSFWDHAVRSVRIGRAVLEVDPSGCYRVR